MLVAMTGWGQEQDKRPARNAGSEHHLLKPIEFDTLVLLLEERAQQHA